VPITEYDELFDENIVGRLAFSQHREVEGQTGISLERPISATRRSRKNQVKRRRRDQLENMRLKEDTPLPSFVKSSG